VHIGDPVFSLVATDLIRDLFPHLSVGPSSVRLIGLFLPGLPPEYDPLESEGSPETHRYTCESVGRFPGCATTFD
jgi:hypothetical protein